MPTYDYRVTMPGTPSGRAEMDPTQYWPGPDLSNVLALMPSYSGPSPRAMACLDAYGAAGMDPPVASFGYSDVAAHRNLVAARARSKLLAEPRYRYVLWLDDDVLASPAPVAALRAIAQSIEQPDSSAVTACYCKRGNPRAIAQRIMGKGTTADVTRQCAPGSIITEPVICAMPEVTGGMGFLLVPRELFLLHCAEVGDAGILMTGVVSEPVPALCASGPIEGADGKRHWQSEDIGYTSAIPVLAAPFAVGHLSQVALLPYPEAKWL